MWRMRRTKENKWNAFLKDISTTDDKDSLANGSVK